MQQTVLITGGAGYLGSHLCALFLQAGWRVRAIDVLWFDPAVAAIHYANPNYQFIRADLRDAAKYEFLLQDVDYVVHAAAVVGEPASRKYPQLTREINLEASLGLIDAVAKSQVHGFIFLSTCSNYGIAEGVATEETPLKALSFYAETKVAVEQYLMAHKKSVDWVICRLSTLYGASPRMRFDLTVNDFCLKAFQSQYLDIFLPLSFRPYLHVFDAARVLVEIASRFDLIKGEVFNLGFQGENYQKIEIANLVEKYLPETRIEAVESGADLRDYQVDFSKLEKALGIKPVHDVAGGVREVLGLLQAGLLEDPSSMKYVNHSLKAETQNGNRVGCA